MGKIQKTDEQWQKELSPDLYHIARQKGTEAPNSGSYVYSKETGVFICAVCDNPLFASDSKFVTHVPGLMGWPSFDKALPAAVKLQPDQTLSMKRTEVLCANCDSHLGHLFEDFSEAKTGEHYCINSICLKLEEKKQK